jgi:hypothetical protein
MSGRRGPQGRPAHGTPLGPLGRLLFGPLRDDDETLGGPGRITANEALPQTHETCGWVMKAGCNDPGASSQLEHLAKQT